MDGCEQSPFESITPVEQTFVLPIEDETPFITELSVIFAEARCAFEKAKNRVVKIKMAKIFFVFTKCNS